MKKIYYRPVLEQIILIVIFPLTAFVVILRPCLTAARAAIADRFERNFTDTQSDSRAIRHSAANEPVRTI